MSTFISQYLNGDVKQKKTYRLCPTFWSWVASLSACSENIKERTSNTCITSEKITSVNLSALKYLLVFDPLNILILSALIVEMAILMTQINCNFGILLFYYHWIDVTVWWTVSPRGYHQPISPVWCWPEKPILFWILTISKVSRKLRSISLVQSSALRWFWRYS